MRLTMDITHKGITDRVRPTVGDMVRFERVHGKSIADAGTSGGITSMAWLAWSYCQRNSKTSDPFEKWAEDLDDLEIIGDDAAPLAPAPSPG